MDAIAFAQKHIEEFNYFAHQAILTNASSQVGHQVILIANNKTLGGGTSETLETATQIALAESLEQQTLLTASDQTLNSVLFDQFPTSCGFAAGFDLKHTQLRSVFEAVERWAWEQWIDLNFVVPNAHDPKLSPLSRGLIEDFDEVIFLKKSVLVSLYGQPLALYLHIVLGIKDGGVFPGSRVSIDSEDWEHACIEAERHLKIYQHELLKRAPEDFIEARIKFFAENKDKALSQISKAGKDSWPMAHMLLSRQLSTNSEYFVFRSVCQNFKGWHLGDEKRFIY